VGWADNAVDRVRRWLDRVYRQLDAVTGGAPGILKRAGQRYGQTRASQAAAGLAYYLFFSLFPLLIVLVAAASYIWDLESELAFQEAVRFIAEIIPVSHSLIADNLQTVLETRGAVTVVGLIGTVWSASSAFTIISRNVNAAWENSERRSFLRQRLVALAMVAALVLLLLLSLASSALTGILSRLETLSPALRFLGTRLWALATHVVPVVLSFAMFLALYRWVPNKTVSWRAALWGSGVAAVAWEAAKALFSLYLSSGLAGYELVYGSLASVVALLFWIYLSASIALFGAHLTAAIDREEGNL